MRRCYMELGEEHCSGGTVPVPSGGGVWRVVGCGTGAAFFHLCAGNVIFPVAEHLHLPLLSKEVEEICELQNSVLVHPSVTPAGKLWI